MSLTTHKKTKPSFHNSHRSPLLVKFLKIYLCRQTNAVLSLLLHFWSLWHTRVKLSRADRAFKRGIRTELNWITPPLPFWWRLLTFANGADGKPVIWWLLCKRIVHYRSTEGRERRSCCCCSREKITEEEQQRAAAPPTERETHRQRAERARMFKHVLVNMWGLWWETDVKIDALATVAIVCEKVRNNTITIATAIMLPCSHNSVIPDGTHQFDKIFWLKQDVEMSGGTGTVAERICTSVPILEEFVNK